MRGEKTLRVAVALVLLAVVNTTAAGYIETFDSDNAGWSAFDVNDNGVFMVGDSMYNSSGGNPSGYMSATVDNSPDRLILLRTMTGLSNFGDMTGLTLTVDYKIDGEVTGPDGAMVHFFVGTYADSNNNYFVSKDSYSWNPNGETEWTAHQVLLTAENFFLWPNDTANNKTFEEVIAAPEDIGVGFIGSGDLTDNANWGFSSNSNGATISIDNFGTIPEPATIALLGLGAMALLRKRRT